MPEASYWVAMNSSDCPNFENLIITEGVVFVTKMAPSLSASPNPMPAGGGPGQTTISWKSVEGKVYVSTNGREEVLFAGSPRGSEQANWIKAGSTHEFSALQCRSQTALGESDGDYGRLIQPFLMFTRTMLLCPPMANPPPSLSWALLLQITGSAAHISKPLTDHHPPCAAS